MIKRAWPWPLFFGAAVVWAALIDWTGPLSELHDFRQSQTAISAYWMIKYGIDFLRPPLGLFGAEHMSAPLEFPIFQAITAALARIVGWSDATDVVLAGRLISFISFLAAAGALYRLVALLHDKTLASIATALFLFLPYPVFWSSTVMIEYAALAAALVYVDAVCRVAIKDEYDWRVLAVGSFAGMAALLIKVTTALVYGPALVGLWLYWVMKRERPPIAHVVVATFALAIMPLGVGYAWVAWSDAVKMESPLTQFLTSAGAAGWNYGTLDERLTPLWWAKIFGYWVLQIYAVVGVPFALAGAWALWRREKYLLLFWASAPVAGVFVFFSLYYHHAYYHVAILPGLIVPLAVGLCMVAECLRMASREGVAVASVVVVAWISLYAQTFLPSVDYARDMLTAFRFGPHFESSVRVRDLEIADLVRRYSRPSDVVLLAKGDWSATIALFAERRVVMLADCSADLHSSSAPHIDLYVIDGRRAACPNVSIGAACSLADKDGIGVGNCLER